MIRRIQTIDKRFPLEKGVGSDAIHSDPIYSYAVTRLEDDGGIEGIGFAFTLGPGNELVCQAAKYYAEKLIGKEIGHLMENFGVFSNQLANDQYFRWLGPEKGVVQLALASVTNACFDLWAKKRRLPLWKLLIDLEPEQILNLLDLSYLEDELTKEQALILLRYQRDSRKEREHILDFGYSGYNTSVGWFNYSDDQLKENCKKATDQGFTAMKLKVGSSDADRDIRRTHMNPPDKITDKPALTINGSVAHFSHRIFSGYSEKAPVELRTVFANVLDKFLPIPLVNCENVPSFGRIFLTEQPGRKMVHLLSYVPELRGQIQMIEEPIALTNVKISLRVDGQLPKKVYLAPDKKSLPFKVVDGYVHVTVPVSKGYSLLVFE